LSLLFGKPQLSFSRSSSPNFGNQAVHERVIDEREFNSFEENDRQVILAKNEGGNPVTPPTRGSGPSNFPVSPPSGGQPSRSVKDVNSSRIPPKVVDRGLGAVQNKAGIDELPDSSEFIYSLETKTAKKRLKTVWRNPKAKKEVLAGLDRLDRAKLVPRNQKDFKGFKTLKEIKLTNTRMLIQVGKNGAPDEIVAILMRRDLDDIVLKFKNKYE